MTKEQLNQTWDLDVIFAGGSSSPTFDAFLTQLGRDIENLSVVLAAAKSPAIDDFVAWVQQIQDASARIRQGGAFVSCLTAQNVKDGAAKLLSGRMTLLSANLTGLFTQLDALMLAMDENSWDKVLAHPDMQAICFALEERRRRASEKLSSAEETLISDLSVDGYHAWDELYNAIVGRMSIEWEQDGSTVELSMGQAANKLVHPSRDVRENVFAKWETAWANEAEMAGNALNHLAGFRLNVYKHRKWASVLKEPLDVNRMQAATLDTMWAVIAANKRPFIQFLERKAQLLGLEKLGWADVDAPISASSDRYSYEEARNFICEHFAAFSPQMADFARMCFDKRWIEAEDRAGKRPGGFCTSFPVSNETRIFVTFSGTPGNVSTLAHELGHAYHQHVMRGLPQFSQNYAMNVAETASTFAEAIVSSASVQQARTDAEKIALLDDKIGNSIAMFMNIHARFLFENRFYEARRRGLLSPQALSDLMVSAQREAYCDTLSSYHPHFWASKLHFYITRTPFYNFPYTFGYMFSSGIYAQAMAEGAGFAERYVNLLRDTGSMQVEDLAHKHLGVDLTQPAFWQSAVDLAAADVSRFLELTGELV